MVQIFDGGQERDRNHYLSKDERSGEIVRAQSTRVVTRAREIGKGFVDEIYPNSWS